MPEPFRGGAEWVSRGDTMLIPILDGTGAFRRWVLGSDTAWTWGNPPPSRPEGQSQAYLTCGQVGAAAFSDGLVMLAPADSLLVVYDAAGAVRGHVRLPLVRRRALSPDAERLVREGYRRSPPQYVLPGTLALGIHKLPDGSCLTVQMDADVSMHQNPVGLD